MKNGTLWKVIITYPNGATVTKYKRAKELVIGSHHAAHIVMSKDYPEIIAKVSDDCATSSLASEYKSSPNEKSVVVDSDKVSFEIFNVEDKHKPVQFNGANVADPNSTSTEFALWHYVDNVLLETEAVQALDQNQKDAYEIFSPMRSGISVQWQQLEQRLVIKYPNGEIRSVQVQRQDDGAFVGSLENEKFVLVRANKEKYDFVPKDYEAESDPYNKYFMAFLASWFLLIGLVNFGAQFLPAIDEEQLAQEELPELMKKVEIAKAEMKENAKNGQGGNGMAGGGGVQDGGNDRRGGGGFVSDEVAVSNLQALSGSAGVFDAIGALDKRMAAKGAKTASLGPSNATANSILGALGALGGGKKKGGQRLRLWRRRNQRLRRRRRRRQGLRLWQRHGLWAWYWQRSKKP
jgi:hypothetical protein